MLEEGYPSVTSRRVAARAGLKPQLVHYYFRTMDDLFLALFRRGAELGLQRWAAALEAGQPLWALWDLSRDPRGTALTMEFTALGNHRKEIRAEIGAASARYRTVLFEGIRAAFERYGVDQERYPPMICSVLMTSLSTFLVLESEMLGLTAGHDETVALVEDFICQLEGERRHPPEGVPSA